LRPRRGGREGAVDAARRCPDRPRALRGGGAGVRRAAFLILLVALAAAATPASAATPQRVDREEAIAAANRGPKVRAGKEEHRYLAPSAAVNEGHWEVAYFAAGKEVALVLVDRHSGEVLESWTGYQVNWKMARGYSGAFGHKLNAPYVFLPLCAI